MIFYVRISGYIAMNAMHGLEEFDIWDEKTFG